MDSSVRIQELQRAHALSFCLFLYISLYLSFSSIPLPSLLTFIIPYSLVEYNICCKNKTKQTKQKNAMKECIGSKVYGQRLSSIRIYREKLEEISFH